MDAVQLVRWTRFAAKGGIGKCTAIHDCVAQNSEDLMFLKGDEIIVLMQIPQSGDLFLGSCEDVIGRFQGKDVHFHGKLKRPVITKRSSVSTTKSSSPNTGRLTPSPSRASSLTLKDQSPPSTLFSHSPLHSVAGRVSPPPMTDDEGLNLPSMLISISSSPSNSVVVAPTRALSDASGTSLGSNSADSSQHLSSSPLRSSRIIPTNSPPMSAPAVSPLQIIKKSPTSPSLHQSSFATAQEQLLNTHTSVPPIIPNDSYSTYDEQTLEDADSDGEVGIGLSLLQNLAHDSDSDDDSNIEHVTVHHDDESTVEGLMYDEPVDEGQTKLDGQAPALAPRVNIEQDSSASGRDHTQTLSLSSRPPSSPSPSSPTSLPSLSPSAHQQHFSVSSRRPSLQSSSSWEGAGDIYDDYRYSTPSIISGTSRARRSSASSRISASSKTSHRDAWDGHVYEPPPPVPDRRPSIDSVIAGENPTKAASDSTRRSVDSRKSDIRKSNGSRKSTESESRRSRQELHFPQPPTIVNIQPDLLDHVIRESLRRSADASRTLTRADFRLSVESEASVYSRLSIVEQESTTTTQTEPPPAPATMPLESSAQLRVNSKAPPSRPTPLDLAQDNSPLLHATWASPISSPSDSAFAASSIGSPTTSLFMPTALTPFTIGMASALRQKVETGRKSEGQTDEENERGGGEGTVRDIVVQDEEDIPSGVVQESTFDTEYSQDTHHDTSKDTIMLPEFVRTDSRSSLNSRTQAPASSLEPPGPLGGLESLPSPTVPIQPPVLHIHAPDEPTESSSNPQTLTPAAPNHLRHLCPTLAELREAGGDPIPGTDKRRSLFLPHPNAPKAPSLSSGPMYLTVQQPLPAPQAPTSVPKQSVLDVIQKALHTPPSPAMRPKMISKGPTIYGQTDVDLNTSTGPVPITFSIDPPPPQPTARPSPQPSLHQLPPQLPPPQQDAPNLGAPPSPRIPQMSRSATGSPVSQNPLPGPGGLGVNTAPGSAEVNEHPVTNGVIPRANFYPKAPGVRPRSRSFSAFNSHSTQVEVPLPLSREEGTRPLNTPTANDVRESLRASPRTSLSSLPPQTQTPNKSNLRKASPLRPSPLSTTSSQSSHSRPESIDTIPRAPSSPFIQQSFRRPSLSNTAPSSPTIAAPNTQVLRPPHQLRQVTSSSTLNDAVLSRPTLSVLSPPDASPASASGILPKESLTTAHEPHISSPPHEQLPDLDQLTLNGETRTQHISPPPAPHRQLSLRTKLSLPNLRRNRSKNDDSFTLGSPTPEHDVSGTVQVQDLDFELVRPTIQFQHARSSEDSGVLGRDTSVELSSRDRHAQRAASPSVSLASPTGEGSGPWSRPSFSSTATPIVTRAVADTESNMDAHRHRESKWMSLMSSVPASQWRKSKKVKKLLHEGVPSSVRYLVWSHLTDGKAKVVPGVYFQLGNRGRIAAANMIEEDIKTCFNDQPHLQGKRGPVLALLQAYLTMVPDVHYTMGLTLIAGQLILHAPEEDAFWIFVSVMNTHVRPYFSSNAIQMDVDASLFSRVVEQNDSQLARKLYVDMGIEPDSICSLWFSTLFVGTLPPEYVNRIWDMFLYEGIPFLLRVGFAVMNCCRRQILGANSPEVVLDYLRHPSPGWLPSTPEGFLSLTYSVKMKDDDIRKNRLKMEAQVKRQTQAQAPRHFPITTNISLLRS